MADTVVLRLGDAAGRRLYDALGREPFQFVPVPHAHWSARGGEVVATLYRSGKLVVQGRGAAGFVERFLADVPRAASAPSPAPDDDGVGALDVPTIGTDESGKGDYFGPLVVAAALVRPEDLAFLEPLGVTDSKLATAGRIRRAEGALLGRLPHAVRVLGPSAYNDAYAVTGNLNVLLGRLHAEVIEEVLAAASGGAARIVIDRFGDPRHVRSHFSTRTRALPFAMPVRGERNPAVAAASFLARAAFLRAFDELKALAGDELYLGASDPRIVPLARRLVREGGEAWLARFAKLHFKLTDRARGRS